MPGAPGRGARRPNQTRPRAGAPLETPTRRTRNPRPSHGEGCCFLSFPVAGEGRLPGSSWSTLPPPYLFPPPSACCLGPEDRCGAGRNRSSTTAIARLVTGPLITALPYWWRLMQCLRRWCVGWPGPDSPSTLPPVCLSSIAMLGRDGGEVKGEGERGILTQRAWSRTKGMSRVLSPAPPAPSEEQGTAQADSPLRLSFRAPPNQLHFLGSAICLPESLPPDESLDGAPNPLGA